MQIFSVGHTEWKLVSAQESEKRLLRCIIYTLEVWSLLALDIFNSSRNIEFAVTSGSLCLKLVIRNSIEIRSIIAAACSVTREFVFVLSLFFHVIDNLDWKKYHWIIKKTNLKLQNIAWFSLLLDKGWQANESLFTYLIFCFCLLLFISMHLSRIKKRSVGFSRLFFSVLVLLI